MSESAHDHDLMVLVERVVRPVRASGKTRMRMRRELLAHVEEIFAEESAAGRQHTAALIRTAQRFGPPDEVRESLQATVGLRERYSYWADHLLTRRPGESRLFCSLRAGVTVGLVHLALTTACVFIATMFGRQSPLTVLPFLVLLSAVFAVNMSVISFLGTVLADRFLHVPEERPRNVAALVLGTVAMAVVVAGSEALLMAAAGADLLQLLRLTAAAGAAALVICPIVLLAYVVDRRPALAWESLELSGG